jgi:hypothetical protein
MEVARKKAYLQSKQTDTLTDKILKKERELISLYPLRRQSSIVRKKLFEYIKELTG